MPSICTANDANQLVSQLIKTKSGAVMFCDSIVTNETFVMNCTRAFDDVMAIKAETVSS